MSVIDRTARMEALVAELRERTAEVARGGGEAAVERHRSRGKLPARERIDRLVDPGLLDRRDDAAHRRPHVPRVLAVEAVPRAHEDDLRAAPQRFRRAHRRVDPESPRDVVGGRDHTAPVRISADDERLRP